MVAVTIHLYERRSVPNHDPVSKLGRSAHLARTAGSIQHLPEMTEMSQFLLQAIGLTETVTAHFRKRREMLVAFSSQLQRGPALSRNASEQASRTLTMDD